MGKGRPNIYQHNKAEVIKFLQQNIKSISIRQISIGSKVNATTTKQIIEELLRENLVDEKKEVFSGKTQRSISLKI